MQGSDNSAAKPAVKKKKGGQGGLVLFILLLGVGGAGFGLGFTQKFAPVELVAPDTTILIKTSTPAIKPAASTTPATSPATTTPVTAVTPAAATSTTGGTSPSAAVAPLKHAYWLQTSGWDRAGYDIKVYINDQAVGTFSTIDRTEDITKLVKAGDNKVRFDAKALPAGNRNDYTGSFLTVTINQGQKTDTGYKDAKALVEYTRKVSETDNFDDTMDFATLE